MKKLELNIKGCEGCPYCVYDPHYGMSSTSGFDCKNPDSPVDRIANEDSPEEDKLSDTFPEGCPLPDIEEAADEMTILNLEIIQSFGLPEKSYRPDHDDSGITVTLPNGIDLDLLIICNGSPTDCDALEGLDGYIYITTKEELADLVSYSYEQAIEEIAKDNKDFNKEDYI